MYVNSLVFPFKFSDQYLFVKFSPYANPVSRNCAITMLTVKPHIITSTKLYHQSIALGSQYSDPMLEAAMLH